MKFLFNLIVFLLILSRFLFLCPGFFVFLFLSLLGVLFFLLVCRILTNLKQIFKKIKILYYLWFSSFSWKTVQLPYWNTKQQFTLCYYSISFDQISQVYFHSKTSHFHMVTDSSLCPKYLFQTLQIIKFMTEQT